MSEIKKEFEIEDIVFGIDNLFTFSKSFKSIYKENVVITIKTLSDTNAEIVKYFQNIRTMLRGMKPIISGEDAMLLLYGFKDRKNL